MIPNVNSQRIRIHILVYGEYYIDCFLRYLSPSLLSNFVEGNELDSVFELHISTTLRERKKIESEPIFNALKEKFGIYFDYIEEPLLNSSNKWKHRLIMSAAHTRILKKAFADKTLLSYLMADCIVSNNYLAEVYSLKSKKVKLLLAPAVRLSYLDELVLSLDKAILKNGKYLDKYSPRNLVRVAFESFHDEARCFFFHSRDFLNYQNYMFPTTVFFRNNLQQNSLVGFGQSWFMVGINTDLLSQDEFKNACKVLEYEAYDVSFVKELCGGKLDQVEFIDDSDRFFLVSWDELNTRNIDRKRIQNMSNELKIDIIEWGMRSGVYDSFRLKCFSIPFFWHVDDLEDFPRTELESPNNEFGIPRLFVERFLQRENSKMLKKSLVSYLRLNNKILHEIESRQRQSHMIKSKPVRVLEYFNRKLHASLRFARSSWYASLRFARSSWYASLRFARSSWYASLRFARSSWYASLRFARNMYYFNKRLDNGFNLAGGNRRLMLLRLIFIYYIGFFRKY